MKKSNMITMLALTGIIVVLSMYILITGQTSLIPNGGSTGNSQMAGTGNSENTQSSENDDATQSTEGSTSENESESTKPSETPENKPSNVTASMDTALFIGDSRTVGLKSYTKDYTGTADFFAAVSTTVTEVVHYNAKVDVEGVGNVTITELLSQKKYDKVYIMLGINEADDSPANIAKNTQKLINMIREKQPDTVIFIMANFYVSEAYQSSRPAFATSNMKAINDAQGALANGKDIFYLDANPMFTDEKGHLSSEYSGDGCHLRAKSCKTWAEWIISQTKKCLGL